MDSYFIEDLEVCIVDIDPMAITNPVPRPPTATERRALDIHFSRPKARNKETGELYRLCGDTVKGITGAVLTYARRYIHEGFEVRIVEVDPLATSEPLSRPPTEKERRVLDTYFGQHLGQGSSCGQTLRLETAHIDGINGTVQTHPIH